MLESEVNMKPLEISPDFTIEDIHKIREYNYEMTKNMTRQEKMDYYNEGAREVQQIMQEMKKKNNQNGRDQLMKVVRDAYDRK